MPCPATLAPVSLAILALNVKHKSMNVNRILA
jgi:hypothetical protein